MSHNDSRLSSSFHSSLADLSLQPWGCFIIQLRELIEKKITQNISKYLLNKIRSLDNLMMSNALQSERELRERGLLIHKQASLSWAERRDLKRIKKLSLIRNINYHVHHLLCWNSHTYGNKNKANCVIWLIGENVSFNLPRRLHVNALIWPERERGVTAPLKQEKVNFRQFKIFMNSNAINFDLSLETLIEFPSEKVSKMFLLSPKMMDFVLSQRDIFRFQKSNFFSNEQHTQLWSAWRRALRERKKERKLAAETKKRATRKDFFFQKFSLMISPQRFDKFDYLNYIF